MTSSITRKYRISSQVFTFFFITAIHAFQYFRLEQRCFWCIALENHASRMCTRRIVLELAFRACHSMVSAQVLPLNFPTQPDFHFTGDLSSRVTSRATLVELKYINYVKKKGENRKVLLLGF